METVSVPGSKQVLPLEVKRRVVEFGRKTVPFSMPVELVESVLISKEEEDSVALLAKSSAEECEEKKESASIKNVKLIDPEVQTRRRVVKLETESVPFSVLEEMRSKMFEYESSQIVTKGSHFVQALR